MTNNHNRPVDDHLPPQKRLAMLRTYAEEQLSTARQAMAEHRRGSVLWRWGLTTTEAMTGVLQVMDRKPDAPA